MASDNIEELVSLVFTVGRFLRDHVEHLHRTDPSSFIQLKTLRFVSHHKNPSMKDIADCLCITPPSATAAINRLVATGELIRSAGKGDRRTVHLAITAKGEKNLSEGFKKVSLRMRSVLKKLSGKERAEFIKILKKILDSHKNK